MLCVHAAVITLCYPVEPFTEHMNAYSKEPLCSSWYSGLDGWASISDRVSMGVGGWAVYQLDIMCCMALLYDTVKHLCVGIILTQYYWYSLTSGNCSCYCTGKG